MGTDVLIAYNTKAMLDNSEFVIILKQQPGAAEKIIEEAGLSPEIVKYITTESGYGKGIIRSGSVIVPFSCYMNQNGRLFNFMDKNFYRDKV